MAKAIKNNTGDQYEITGIEPGPIHWAGRTIDLADQSDEELIKLFEQGCPYIRKKDTSAEV